MYKDSYLVLPQPTFIGPLEPLNSRTFRGLGRECLGLSDIGLLSLRSFRFKIQELLSIGPAAPEEFPTVESFVGWLRLDLGLMS